MVVIVEAEDQALDVRVLNEVVIKTKLALASKSLEIPIPTNSM